MGMMIRKSKHQFVTLKGNGSTTRIPNPKWHITMMCGSTSDTSARKHFETTEQTIMNRTLSSFVGALRSRGGSFCDS
jgi:hypothetical protein